MQGAGEEKRKQAFRLLELTQAMLAMARAEDWLGLARQEHARQDLARDLFATPIPQDATAAVAECIRQVLDLDTELLTLTTVAREDAARAMQEVRHGQKALDIYRRFSR